MPGSRLTETQRAHVFIRRIMHCPVHGVLYGGLLYPVLLLHHQVRKKPKRLGYDSQAGKYDGEVQRGVESYTLARPGRRTRADNRRHTLVAIALIPVS